jgi:transcription-repair coupling factor (superfamily II helicase)
MITLFNDKLTQKLSKYAPYKRLRQAIRGGSYPIDVHGPRGSMLSLLLGNLYQEGQRGIVAVTSTEQEAQRIAQDAQLLGIDATVFPWWQTAPYRPVPSHSTLFGERVRILSRLIDGEKPFLLVPLRALLWPLPSPEELMSSIRNFAVGDEIDPVAVTEELVQFGYSRVPRVSLRGEFALRGEVLDIFPPGSDDGYRIVFGFDEIEEIRSFDPATQSSVRTLDHVAIPPLREVVWDEETLDRLDRRVQELTELAPEREQILSRLREQGGALEGEELFYPLAVRHCSSVLDYVDRRVPLVLCDYDLLESTADGIANDFAAGFREARGKERVPHPDRLQLPFSELTGNWTNRIRVRGLSRNGDGDAEVSCSFSYEPPRSFFGNISFFKEELGNLQGADYEILIFAGSQTQKSRLDHILSDYPVEVLSEQISEGFSSPDMKLAVIQESEIFGRRKRSPRSVRQAKSQAIDTFVDLNPGDYVVHVNYGIGRFCGIQRMRAAGNERDYIQLEYAGEEYVYIPIEQVNLIQRYIGHGGEAPKLDKLGGKSWEKRKSKVQQNVEDLAERLVQLYSRRKLAPGYAFPPDTEWQLQFEASFPYEETEDQLRCIADVKSDMEEPTPMDRLICGDVGYGKTEVAMRAAFKAVSAGRQVAFLAPTTILTEQHYETFTERLEEFPVETAMLSRFVTKEEQKRVLTGLAGGSIDLVVGTHRLLQKDVQFKNLGLLIVDEEQRFGVKDKERLKELKASVDCLTLTATPIPRTLHMSLLKIRDMSVLNTPPHNRRPIETYIEEFNEERVAEAIRREIARGGQVYYLHNRVETLEQVEGFLKKLLPEVLIESAHGQMSSTELEDIMHRFVHGGVQVLVATTIIENGIDIPNVNTIIIDRADMYGISQLYQLRGRVGRSERLAYAYMFYPERRALSEVAMKRLQVISDYTELGSGFKIALKDLEVRGAGNLLGREQSGDILSVGFDLYLKLLDEAIRKIRDQEEEEPPEVYLELDYSGYIPDSYIEEPEEKMEVYKKIAAVHTQEELDDLHAQLEDRYGPLPDEVQSLLSLAEIRIMCRKLFISSLRERRGHVEIEFAKVAKISTDRILQLIEASGGKVKVNPEKPNTLLMETGSVGLKEKSEFIRGRLQSLVT